MFDVQHSIKGIEAITKSMEAVGHEISYKGGRSALRKAANLISNAVKANARRLDDPETSEQIEENVAVRWSSKKFKRTGDLMFRVGILGGARPSGNSKGAPGGDTWYWRMLEFGTRKMSASPFMRPALERNTHAATVEFVQQAKKAIDRAVKKAAKEKK